MFIDGGNTAEARGREQPTQHEANHDEAVRCPSMLCDVPIALLEDKLGRAAGLAWRHGSPRSHLCTSEQTNAGQQAHPGLCVRGVYSRSSEFSHVW